jgi:quercetin 2,3-dioxygenase
VKPGRGVWFQLIKGAADINGTQLAAGDAASTEDSATLTISASEDVEAILFDLK